MYTFYTEIKQILDSIAEDDIYLNHRIWQNELGMDLETP